MAGERDGPGWAAGGAVVSLEEVEGSEVVEARETEWGQEEGLEGAARVVEGKGSEVDPFREGPMGTAEAERMSLMEDLREEREAARGELLPWMDWRESMKESRGRRVEWRRLDRAVKRRTVSLTQ